MKLLLILACVFATVVGDDDFVNPFNQIFKMARHSRDDPEFPDEYNYELAMKKRGLVAADPDLRRCVRCMAFCRAHNLVCITGCLTTLACTMEKYKITLSEPNDKSQVVIFEHE